jgi:hypothetical protein
MRGVAEGVMEDVARIMISELAGFSLQKHGICHVESEPAVIAWLASKGLF